MAFAVGDTAGWDLVRASPRRTWMDQTNDGFANRCLPLTIANQAGWVLSCPVEFSARWNGGSSPNRTVRFRFQSDAARFGSQIRSHFGSGIITFSVPYLFRTPTGTWLIARGLPNEPKANCCALEGLVETDWSTATFTMNWKILRPNVSITFLRGEPICFLQPVRIDVIERLDPRVLPIESAPRLSRSYSDWVESRIRFNSSPVRGASWQKHYHRGEEVGGGRNSNHRTALRLRAFAVKDQGTV